MLIIGFYCNIDFVVCIKLTKKKSFFGFQFPVQSSSHHEKVSEHLGLNYVTARILASVLPRRNAPRTSANVITTTATEPEEHIDDGPHNEAPDGSPQDIYEQELISMLEQKHGKVSKNDA